MNASHLRVVMLETQSNFFVAKSLHFKRTVFSQERFVKNFDFKEVAKIKDMQFYFQSSIHLERNESISSYSTFETYPELS